MSQTLTRIPAIAPAIVPSLTERSTYDATSEVRNVLHSIIGRSDVEATLHAAGLRAGTMTLVFVDRAEAHRALQAHREVGVWRLVDDDVPTASMYYVVDRLLQLTLDPETAREWLLKVGFQEVIL